MGPKELDGRTSSLYKSPLTCYRATIIAIGMNPYTKVRFITTEYGDFKLDHLIPSDKFELNATYFLQTINRKSEKLPIEVVDFIKY